MAFKMKGFPMHKTASTLKQYTSSASAFKQIQVEDVEGSTEYMSEEEKQKLKKFQEENKIVMYDGKYMTVSEMNKLIQEKKNRENTDASKSAVITDDQTPEISGMLNTTKQIKNKISPGSQAKPTNKMTLSKFKSLSPGKKLKFIAKFGGKRIPIVGAGFTLADMAEGKSFGDAVIDNFLFGDLWREDVEKEAELKFGPKKMSHLISPNEDLTGNKT